MRTLGRYIVVSAVFLVVAPAHAQSASNTRTFIDLSLGADWDDARRSSTRAPGTTLAPGVAFGFDGGVRRRSRCHCASVAREDAHGPLLSGGPLSLRPAATRPLVCGLSDGATPVGDVIVLYRSNVPINRQVTVTGSLGAGRVFRPESSPESQTSCCSGGQLIEVSRYHASSSDDHVAGVARFDVEFKVSSSVSIVPRLLLMAFPSTFDDGGSAPRMVTARPEVVVRWGFWRC